MTPEEYDRNIQFEMDRANRTEARKAVAMERDAIELTVTGKGSRVKVSVEGHAAQNGKLAERLIAAIRQGRI